MYAHYFKSGKDHILILTHTPSSLASGETKYYSSKREVVAEAKVRNATPWNY